MPRIPCGSSVTFRDYYSRYKVGYRYSIMIYRYYKIAESHPWTISVRRLSISKEFPISILAQLEKSEL